MFTGINLAQSLHVCKRVLVLYPLAYLHGLKPKYFQHCNQLSLVVTRGLRLWGQLDVLQNSLKRLWGPLMVKKWTFNSSSTALVGIPAVSMPIARSLKISVALCWVIKLHILDWPFIVASLRHTCAIIMLSNQHLDMPHLRGGWIISAKEKCSLTQI